MVSYQINNSVVHIFFALSLHIYSSFKTVTFVHAFLPCLFTLLVDV